MPYSCPTRTNFERTRRFAAAIDARVQAELEALGWKVITIWECEVKEVVSSGRVPGLNVGKEEGYGTEEGVLMAAEEEGE